MIWRNWDLENLAARLWISMYRRRSILKRPEKGGKKGVQEEGCVYIKILFNSGLRHHDPAVGFKRMRNLIN